MSSGREMAADYRTTLSELTCNNKTQINMLTILAEDYKDYAPFIVNVIEDELLTSQQQRKIVILYVIDSIVKNIPKAGDYRAHFSKNIAKIFKHVFEESEERTRASLYKLRQTWADIFPRGKLYDIDVRINMIDSAWPVASISRPTAAAAARGNSATNQTVHVNPKFLNQNEVAKRVVVKNEPVAVTLSSSGTDVTAKNDGKKNGPSSIPLKSALKKPKLECPPAELSSDAVVKPVKNGNRSDAPVESPSKDKAKKRKREEKFVPPPKQQSSHRPVTMPKPSPSISAPGISAPSGFFHPPPVVNNGGPPSTTVPAPSTATISNETSRPHGMSANNRVFEDDNAYDKSALKKPKVECPPAESSDAAVKPVTNGSRADIPVHSPPKDDKSKKRKMEEKFIPPPRQQANHHPVTMSQPTPSIPAPNIHAPMGFFHPPPLLNNSGPPSMLVPPLLPSAATISNETPRLHGMPANNRVFVDGKAYDVIFLCDVPVIVRNGLPHRVSFSGPPRDIIIDGVLHKLAFGEAKTVMIDGEPHVLRFGAPSRELYMGNFPFRGVFGGPPIVATINGRRHEIRLLGAPPEAKIEQDPSYELARYMDPSQTNSALSSMGLQPAPIIRQEPPKKENPVSNLEVSTLLKKLQHSGILSALASQKKQASEKPPQPSPSTSADIRNSNSPPIPSNQRLDNIERRTAPMSALDQFSMRSLVVRYDSVIEALHKDRVECPSCGIAIKELYGEAYHQHTAWHMRVLKGDKYTRSRPWFMSEEWFTFSETELANRVVVAEGDKATDDQVTSSSGVTAGDALSGDADEKDCCVCNEKFEEYFDEDDDAWKLRDCVIEDGKAFHRYCKTDAALI